MPPLRRELPPITTQQNQREQQEASPAPALPPAPAPVNIQPDPLDQELILETQNVNQAIPVGQEEEPTFARELAETTTQDDELFTAIEQFQAPPVFDALEEAQRLYEEAGVQSLNDQLSVLDSEIGTFDADVRTAIATTRNRLDPLNIINAEVQLLQRNADERRGALLRERQFIQSQIVSRTNIANALVQFGQQTYQNELAAYNAGVDRFIRLYELQQNVQLRNIEIAQRQQAFNQAQADYVMDRIAQAVSAGVTFDEIPASLTDALAPLSESLYGNPEFLPDMVEFLAESGALIGETGDRTNFFPLGTLTDENGNPSGMLLYDRATGRTITVNAPAGTNFIPNQSGSDNAVNIANARYVVRDGRVYLEGIDRRTGLPVSYPTNINPADISTPRPNRNILQELTSGSLPTWLDEATASDIAAAIVSDNSYRNIPPARNFDAQRTARAQEIYGNYIIRNFYQDVFQDTFAIDTIAGTLAPEFIQITGPRGFPNRLPNPDFETSVARRNDINIFLREEILRNTNKYTSAAEVIQDIESNPNLWISEYNKWAQTRQENEQPLNQPTTEGQDTTSSLLDLDGEDTTGSGNQVRGQTQTRGQITEPITNSQPATGTGELVTLTNGRTVNLVPRAARQRAQVSQYFSEDQVNNALAIIDRESKGDPRALNTNGEYSVGLFQINLQFRRGDGTNLGWQPEIRELMGQPNATRNQIRDWLYNPVNNIRAAQLIYNRGNWSEWSTAGPLGLG